MTIHVRFKEMSVKRESRLWVYVVTESFESLKWRSTCCEQLRDIMSQVVAYKRLKTMENYKTVRPKSDCGRLGEVVVYEGF